jgi:YbbR domain-containing protein
MKRKIFRNLGWKLLSLLIAIFLWFYVEIVITPQNSQTNNIFTEVKTNENY